MRPVPEEQLSLDLTRESEPAGPPSAEGRATHHATASETASSSHEALPDSAARGRIAGLLDVNFLVEAGAGSGKTSELVRRMVALVREGAAAVTEIAAVTFTRKAAGELRERFQEALEQERGREGLEAVPQARLERALQDLDRSFMGTIHAFCARLLRERPLEAGVDPAFSELTAVEADLTASRFWRLHLERLAAGGDPVLGDLEDMGLTPHDLRWLYDELRDNLDVDFPMERVPPPDPAVVAQVRSEVDSLLDEAQHLMPREEPAKGWGDLQRRLRSVDYVRRYRPWKDDRVFLDALAELSSRQEWRPVQNRWSDKKEIREAAKQLAARLNGLVAGRAQELLRQWWAHRYPVAMRFALDAALALRQHRLESGTLDFQDLLALAAGLLRKSPGARADLARRWRRVLVDEFQDTDPIQAEVLFLLASDPASDGGDWTRARPRPGALFVVGDPKQSIYRFRRADISLYMLVRERFQEFGRVESLVANFRSGEPIAALVNEVFAPPQAFPSVGNAMQAAFAPLLPQTRGEGRGSEGVFHYDVLSETARRDQVTAWGASALADWIARRTGPDGDRSPGDFLILTRLKEPLEVYARALEARNLPVQVSGAGVGVQEEVAELRLLLEALVDPDDPSKTVAVLLGLFFGLDHEELLAHREADRGFDFRYARAEGMEDPVEVALRRLRSWWQWARTEPADVVVGRIASELGLLPYAAAGELGTIRAGALAFVLDAVRGAGLGGDTSLAGALEALEIALGDDEAEAQLQPGRSGQIRLMNIHKAKGLEGKVVVLAAPVGEWERGVRRHVERDDSGRARGWLQVEKKEGMSTRVLARPLSWAQKEGGAREFQRAEDLRLLYVAATRAEEELVVARRTTKPEGSPWHRFDPWLDTHATRLALSPVTPPPRDVLDLTASELNALTHEAEARRLDAGLASYAFASVTGMAKGETGPVSEPAPGDIPLPEDPGSGPGGYAWGSAVHGLLEAAARGATGEGLRAVGRTLLLDLDRPLVQGEPSELDALLTTCRRVLESELWRRSGQAEQTLAEVPFALAVDRGRLDPELPPTWMEGVIDLAFREPEGWVIVDYKTDRGDDPEFPARRAAYRRQLGLYARAWEQLTGEPVKESLLWFVRTSVVEAVEGESA